MLTENPRPGIPGGPIDMTVDPTMEAAFTIVCGLPAVLVVVLAARALIRDRNYVFPVLLLGGIIGMFVEPILDYMGGVWWPAVGDWEAFTLLGVNIPAGALLLPMGYLGTYAAIGFPVWISLNSGWSSGMALLAGVATFALGWLLVVLVSEVTSASAASAASSDARDGGFSAVVGGVRRP